MPLKDVKATPEQLSQMETNRSIYYRDRERFLEQEALRMSDVRTWSDGEGTTWAYALIDGEFVRVLGCETSATSLRIPSAVEGLPVREVAPDSCAALEGIESIECPDSIEVLGQAAFRRNPNLRCVVLPANMDVFDYTWVRECPKLVEIVLPGRLERIDPTLFNIEGLKAIAIGPGTTSILPGSFSRSVLERIEVSSDNPSIFTDGHALFADGGARLEALAVPTSRYDIPAGCETVAAKAFSGHRELREVTFPLEGSPSTVRLTDGLPRSGPANSPMVEASSDRWSEEIRSLMRLFLPGSDNNYVAALADLLLAGRRCKREPG